MDEKLDQIIELLQELLSRTDESTKSAQVAQRDMGQNLYNLVTGVRNDNSEDLKDIKSVLTGIREDLNYLKQRTESRQPSDERVIRSRRRLVKILRDYLKQEDFDIADPMFFILFFLLIIPSAYPPFDDKESYIFWREFIENLRVHYR
jgi:hypothetical protein